MKMSLEEYSNYLLLLQLPPDSKETVVKTKVADRKNLATNTLKRKTYRKRSKN